MDRLDIMGQLADLKDVDYKNTLGIVSIIELLIEKGILTKSDITKKAKFLDSLTVDELKILKTSEK